MLANNARTLREDVARRASGEKVLRHVPTGFDSIDSVYGGMRIGVATEIMAHTGDGKSAFMRQLAEGAARSGSGVLWFVGEDPEDATAERQFAGDTGMSSSELGRLNISQAQLSQIDLAVQQAAPWAKRILPVFDTMDVDDVLRTIDETTTIGGAPLQSVLVDYVQIFAPANDLEAEIARLGLGMKDRSRERKFAIGLGSQVSNDVIKRGRDRFMQTHDAGLICPMIGDTEWCKRLEKVVKAVWAIVRPGRWLSEWGEDARDDYAEFHVRKANFGGMGWLPLKWDGPTTKFSDGDRT